MGTIVLLVKEPESANTSLILYHTSPDFSSPHGHDQLEVLRTLKFIFN